MSKASNVLNAAASGVKSRSFHPMWNDVNPLKQQGITPLERKLDAWKHIHHQEQLERKLKTARVLYAVSKY